MRNSFLKRVLATILILNTAMLGIPHYALAAPIGTQTLIQIEDHQARVDRVQAMFLRADVRDALVALGVAPEDAQARVATLTEEELRLVEQQMDNLPAGGSSVLVIIGIVFLVLIILELVGVTNVFTGFGAK